MVRSMLCNLQVYWASGLFCLRVHHEVDKILGSYLCRGKEEVRGGVKVAWMKMCLPFKEGGFVIRDESSWNIAREVVGMAEDVEYGLIRGCRGVPYLSRLGRGCFMMWRVGGRLDF
ncbi:zf-RVT domain-containing protein [Cucumis melo var. makuwa]|uniref:Zf-RVT domain-containing protein n=1 Tax=Cucumis melo var. makuwa TaxID=1194695 RepID=A0A5D3DG73_CUCMM|nr:zf-RVT domain-containing protein [Cucumis melo var. makuwa]